METWLAITFSMLIPFLAMISNLVLRDRADLRDGMTLLAAVLTFACVLVVLGNEGSGTTGKMVVGQVMPGIELAFHVEGRRLYIRDRFPGRNRGK